MTDCMCWSSLLSRRRLKLDNGVVCDAGGPQLAPDNTLRSEFHVDHDRVVFSSAFRRLGRKTQVHPLAQHDHTHNRLTHSIEVASVGRSLGNQVGAGLMAHGRLPGGSTPFDIGTVVQVACLAHDIGNPPFGHTGEDAMRRWFRDPAHSRFLAPLTPAERQDIQTYEGNAHGLRMVATLEMHTGRGGMRLTCASLGTLAKYPWTSDVDTVRGKFNVYRSELPYFRQVAQELGLIQTGENTWSRHPLVYLMEAADDLCYAILDLEDAVEIGIIDSSEFEELLTGLADISRARQISDTGQRCAMLRGTVIGLAVQELAGRFLQYETALLRGEFPAKDLIDVCSEPIRSTLSAAKKLAAQRVYHHPSKLAKEIATYACLATLLDTFVPAVWKACLQPERLDGRDKMQLELLQPAWHAITTPYQGYMQVLDFVGGLTDNHAARLAKELSGFGLAG
ncbi:deoxyguanosinetriphosphate triphosphohydrolase [Laribacter hongkongensis]|uniref:deoxyguanosinetriphosphate triphosphohydrolase n=1 Tax=Laribacter hongkongensis TaxID=168471 RepID=UPI001EFC4F87|nr:deoxyguanosinetriphosphate triphosphohydrolase [Laribacter hongkongensis]MCG9033143.1 deoxyguanosinetriphosphate triphosphohydrolase [Laribacter hongkongensis]MCG9093273.1 deoxyguanosinetriphosphate triphosphohydrolase [Laribacter hongkongensis]